MGVLTGIAKNLAGGATFQLFQDGSLSEFQSGDETTLFQLLQTVISVFSKD